MDWNPARVLRNHYGKVWAIALALSIAPLGRLGFDAWTGSLGINPLERLNHTTGIWALNLLIITLAITPLRRLLSFLLGRIGARFGKRLSDWNALIRLRRTFGLLSFLYVVLHVGIYLWLEHDWNIEQAIAEIAGKRYLAIGTLAFILMIPLALTSTKAMMRRLGGNWKRLHRAVYAIGIASALHYLWLGKVGVAMPAWYGAALTVLLAYRVFAHFGVMFHRPLDRGEEVPERMGKFLKPAGESADMQADSISQNAPCRASRKI